MARCGPDSIELPPTILISHPQSGVGRRIGAYRAAPASRRQPRDTADGQVCLRTGPWRLFCFFVFCAGFCL
jgi:hypothetical protein